MGIWKGKRKHGIKLSYKKVTSYAKRKMCYNKGDSPFPKRLKCSPSFRTSTPFKTSHSPRRDTPVSSRKQLFESSVCDLNDITNEFSLLDISETEDTEKSEIGTFIPSVGSSDTNPVREEFLSLVPSALHELEKAGKGDVLQKFLSQVSSGKFPLTNIAFQLWCDVVDWYEKSDTRQMRYSPETLQFFWVGKKLFGGRFIRFMSGMKNETQQLEGNTSYDPQLSKINFACPSENVIADADPFDGNLPLTFPPGFLEPMIKLKAESDVKPKSYVIMFDGKKVKRGGDVDLLGFENDKTLTEKLEEKAKRDNLLQETVEIVSRAQRESDFVSETPEAVKPQIFSSLINLLMLFSTIIKSLRGLKVKKTIAMENLKKKCDTNWQNTKYAYSIDACRTTLWRITNCIEKALNIIKCVCKAGAYINGTGHLFAKTDIVNLEEQGNVRILKSPDQLCETPTDRSFIKQRTPQWEAERKHIKVTGSSMYQAVGCDGLKRQREHFDKVILNVEPPKPSAEQKIAMQRGIDSEIHQVATLSSVIVPFLFPDLTFFEEGFYIKDNVLVSPDGSLQNSEKTTAHYAFEGKAPGESMYTPGVHYKVPERYISQTLFEQRVTKARQGTLYMAWTPESCTLFKVSPNEDTCNLLLSEIERIFSDDPKRPSRILESAKKLKTDLKNISENCEFLGEFPSVQGFITENLSDADKENPSPFRLVKDSNTSECNLTYDELMRKLILGKEVLNDAYELDRSIASQVVVFLLADLDRFWKAEEPHAIPVAYFFRGYSLSMDITRRINEQCKLLCRNNGLDVIATAADGEFSNLMVRGNNDNPLTQHQLSKDLWSEVSKLSKVEIITKLKDDSKEHMVMNETLHNAETGEESVTHILMTKSKNLQRIETPKNGWQQKRKGKQSTDVVIEQTQTVSAEQRDGMDIEIDSNSVEQSNLLDIQDDADDTILYEPGEEFNDITSNKDILADIIPGILTNLQILDKKKWKEVDAISLAARFESAQTLKQFTVKELQEISKYINLRQSDDSERLKVSGMHKADLINQISRKVCDGSRIEHIQRRRVSTKVPTLAILSQRAIMKKSYPKHVLNIAYCNYLWPERKKRWLKKAHVHESISIVGIEEELSPYYVPDFQRHTDDFEVSVYDKTHLGSNLRKAICLDNVQGINNKAWFKVAEINPDVLNKSIIEVSEEGKILDQMKEKIARSMFTEEVESLMSGAGYEKEAKFCRIVREGLYTAEDEPGISAIDRCRMRINLINWLSEGVDFGKFPPYGGRIKGLSHILYEGLRCSNEAKLYLYALSKTGSYCARAPNTLCSESFFSTMQEMDPWGQGVLTTAGVKKHISDFTTVTALKMKSDKPFYIRTKKDAAYPVPETYNNGTDLGDQIDDKVVCDCRQQRYLKCIIPRDHYFDTQERARRSYKVKPFKFSGINDPARGDLPIRSQYGYRLNEAKMFQSNLAGLKFSTDT